MNSLRHSVRAEQPGAGGSDPHQTDRSLRNLTSVGTSWAPTFPATLHNAEAASLEHERNEF